jgi:hypothetical protein
MCIILGSEVDSLPSDLVMALEKGKPWNLKEGYVGIDLSESLYIS